MKTSIILIIASLALPPALSAQAPGMSIERNKLSMKDTSLIAIAQALRDEGKLLGKDQVIAAMKALPPVTIILPAANTKHLEPSEIAARARKALVRVGWFYLCPRCDKMHVNLAGVAAKARPGLMSPIRQEKRP